MSNRRIIQNINLGRNLPEKTIIEGFKDENNNNINDDDENVVEAGATNFVDSDGNPSASDGRIYSPDNYNPTQTINYCNSNQIYDLTLDKCIGCRDPTVKPNVTELSVTKGKSISGSVDVGVDISTSNGNITTIDSKPGMYMCSNNPVKTYRHSDLDGRSKDVTPLSYTCDSGEIFNPDSKKCTIIFMPQK
jgi:hypothetical protein